MKEFWQARSKTRYLWHNFTARRYLHLIRNVRNWLSFVLWKWRGYPGTIEIILRSGFRFEVTPDSRTEFKVVFMREDYTWPLQLTGAADTGTIVDLGANVGFFTLFAASRFPHCPIVSVEPYPSSAKALADNVRNNRLSNCQTLQVAVSNARGTVTFGSTSPVPNPVNARITPGATIDGRQYVACPTITLDDLMRDHVSGDVAFLKLDIEGAEYDVLYGASDAALARIKRIALETEDLDAVSQNTEALTSFLRGKGFRTVEVTPHLLHGWRG
jgi:FkbM family methyltransferase